MCRSSIQLFAKCSQVPSANNRSPQRAGGLCIHRHRSQAHAHLASVWQRHRRKPPLSRPPALLQRSHPSSTPLHTSQKKLQLKLCAAAERTKLLVYAAFGITLFLGRSRSHRMTLPPGVTPVIERSAVRTLICPILIFWFLSRNP